MAETSTASFLDYAADLRREVDAALSRCADFDSDCPVQLREAIQHSLLGPGKRLRPMLVLMAAEACGCQRNRAMPAACAVEMVHTYSLIHDDLPAMDDDDLRRGRPACHAKYGEALAILAGDALLTRSFEVLATQVEPPAVAARCCAALGAAAGASALVGGQVDDLAAQSRSAPAASGEFSDADAELLVRIHRRKTGAMFRVSLTLGGLVSQASNEQLGALETYGDNLGLAFQIVDDLLDVSGQESSMGKRLRKDLDRGKLTYPGLLGVAESTRRAEQLIDDAGIALTTFGSRAGKLAELAQYVLERNH